ncbi:MAG: hypothetical protein FJX75_02145 [Armatimonadetes bacterium]|nr:hypothetical protein [Armatimonadota bacterium]
MPRIHLVPFTLALLAVMLMSTCNGNAEVRLKVLRGEAASGPNLLQNPGFEELQGGRPVAWRNWEVGFQPAPGEGRDGSAAVTCVWQKEGEQYGASQTVALNQEKPTPIIVRAWSKAREVSGTADREYALYCDLQYMDGTPLWGQVASFDVGTHDWQQREVMILPAKPVRSITVHCLFRGHHGQVWFDDAELHQLAAAAGSAILDGVPVAPYAEPMVASVKEMKGAGLTLFSSSATGVVTAVAVGARGVSSGAVGGFLVRDAAANSDWHSFRDDRCEELGLELAAQWKIDDQAIRLSGTLRDTTGKDRAVTLLFALPVDARGATWGAGLRGGRAIAGGEYSSPVSMGTGATGTLAQYPFSCVCTKEWGLGLGVDPAKPSQYRLAYNADTEQYFAAFDFGLVPDTQYAPSAASFGLVIYAVDPAWGFRSAVQRYYDLFPEAFACRSKQQGIWMPFSKISQVEGWQDFGFKYKEGNDETAWDDQHDILTFRYTEPSTWWMAMPKEMPRTYEAAIDLAGKIARGEVKGSQAKAQALLTSGLFDEQGRYMMRFLDTPWCDGAVFSMSCLPGIPGEVNDAKIGWNERTKEQLYGPNRQGDLDGEYLDSLEGYVTNDLNFRREHFAVANRPLTFTMSSHVPVIHKGLAVDEFVQWIADDVHGLGKLMMANGVPYRFTFLCRNLDVMGTETDWVRQGKWQPMGHDHLSLIRTMCAQKPYLFLMNTDFDALEPYVDRYFQRSLFYGMYPSMFSPVASSSQGAYWITPRWYNRDRELHKKYQPIIRRVAEAGWQPITRAKTDAPGILLERFGPNAAGETFITVFNDGKEAQTATVTVDASLAKGRTATELVSGQAIPASATNQGTVSFTVTLQPEQCAAVRLSGRGDG